MVEGTALEMRQGGNPFESSNLSSSALLKIKTPRAEAGGIFVRLSAERGGSNYLGIQESKSYISHHHN